MKGKYIILNILIINFINGNYIKLNFYKDKYISPYHIDNVFFSCISTDIYFGTPPFKITLQITTDTPYFIVRGSSSDNEYKQENSSSFYFTKYGQTYEYKNIYFHSIFFNENFQFNEQIINLNSMMYWGKYPITNNYGLLGLQLKDIKFQEKNIFINQLYDKGLIANKMFSLVYKNENKGELIVGDFPSGKTELLKGKKFKMCKNNFKSDGIVYGTNFEEIKFIDINLIFKNIKANDLKYTVIFSNTYYGYIGSQAYNNFIYETFFKLKLINKSCWTQNIDNDRYYGYVCSKRVDMSSIPNIKLYHKELNFTFEIENKDMWIKHKNIKYFLVFFSHIEQFWWTLGQKFLEKYTFVFNGEDNIIGFYYDDKIIKNTRLYIYIILYLLLIIIIAICIRFVFLYHSNRNKKIEEGVELEEIF